MARSAQGDNVAKLPDLHISNVHGCHRRCKIGVRSLKGLSCQHRLLLMDPTTLRAGQALQKSVDIELMHKAVLNSTRLMVCGTHLTKLHFNVLLGIGTVDAAI